MGSDLLVGTLTIASVAGHMLDFRKLEAKLQGGASPGGLQYGYGLNKLG